MRIVLSCGVVVLFGLLAACAKPTTARVVDPELRSDLEAVRVLRIFFGHQSVGRNILGGIERLSRDTGIPIRITGSESAPSADAWLAESAIGVNGDPQSKCDDFQKQVTKLGARLDVAVMKFCYADFDAASDADSVLLQYSQTIGELQKQFPRVTFIHATAPLKIAPSGIRHWIKHTVGAAGEENQAANLKRSRFNELLRTRYLGELIFDLAGVESTGADGVRTAFTLDGQTGFALLPAYSSDGGHLNDLGSAVAARELIRIIAVAARTHSSQMAR